MGEIKENWIIRMDVAALPGGLNINDWYDIVKDHRIIVYDSNKGEIPTFIDTKGKNIKIMDYEEWNSKEHEG